MATAHHAHMVHHVLHMQVCMSTMTFILISEGFRGGSSRCPKGRPLAKRAAAGGLGAAARFLMDGEIRLRWRGALPLSTLVINVAGSLLLGLTCGLVGTLPTPSLVALVS